MFTLMERRKNGEWWMVLMGTSRRDMGRMRDRYRDTWPAKKFKLFAMVDVETREV